MFASPQPDRPLPSRAESIAGDLDRPGRAGQLTFDARQEATMDDDAVWATELGLWKGGHERVRDWIDPAARMALPMAPFIFAGEQAITAVQSTPGWSNVAFEDGTISRPHSGLIVVAYTAHAQRHAEEAYVAHCTTTYSRNRAGEWQVIQHQQAPRIPVNLHR